MDLVQNGAHCVSVSYPFTKQILRGNVKSDGELSPISWVPHHDSRVTHHASRVNSPGSPLVPARTTTRLHSFYTPPSPVSAFVRPDVRLLGSGAAILLVLLLFASPSHAAHLAPDGPSPPDKYWILLSERPDRPAENPTWTAPVSSAYLSRLRAIGVRPVVHSRWLHAVSAYLSPDQRSAVAALSFVREIRPVASGRSQVSAISPHPPRRALSPPRPDTLQLGASRGPLSRMNAIAPMERGLDGHGVTIGFLDAHFRGLRHAAFASLRRDDRMLALRNFTEGAQGGNHGSAVASVTVGSAPGTLLGPAHEAEVLGATTEYTPSETNAEEDYFVAGLEWLHRRGAQVVNVSIGYNTFDEGEHSYTPDDLDGDTGITTRAVDRAAQLGMTVVVSAGNSGCAAPDSCWYYVNTPADADSAITVGAISPDSSLASFSSRGPTADGRIKPDVVVQGEQVTAAWNDAGFAQVGGTSFASPQVTAIVAQMLQLDPTLSPIAVRRFLRQTASQAHNPDNRKGWGIVNADAALRAVERHARATPPPALTINAPYPNPASDHLTIPVRAPANASSVRVTLQRPTGETAIDQTIPVRPGPNWITLDLTGTSPGLYLYRVQGPQNLKSGTVALPPPL